MADKPKYLKCRRCNAELVLLSTDTAIKCPLCGFIENFIPIESSSNCPTKTWVFRKETE